MADAVSGTVVIVNLEHSARDITLTDGTSIRLAPFSRVGGAHKSEPIPKNKIPDGVKKMATRRWIKFEDVV